MSSSRIITAVAIAIVVLAVVLIASGQLSLKDNRSATDRVGDAIHALPNGPGKAADQLGDRTTGQRVGDQIQQMGK